MTLNIGCGSNKISTVINADINFELKPEVVIDFKKPFPFKPASFDQIYFFHTIEHIEEVHHPIILQNIWLTLKPEGLVVISYPEFTQCAKNYIENHHGKRDFWKATIYGRQSSKFDYHVSLMDSEQLADLLQIVGFKDLKFFDDPDGPHYTVVSAKKGIPMVGYEELLYQEIFKA